MMLCRLSLPTCECPSAAQYTEAHPGKRLGAADQERSSPAWDAIALAALPTCLSGLFPSSLCSMYAATTTDRKLAAGIPARHHWPGGCASLPDYPWQSPLPSLTSRALITENSLVLPS